MRWFRRRHKKVTFDPDRYSEIDITSDTWHATCRVVREEKQKLLEDNASIRLTETQTATIRGKIQQCDWILDLERKIRDDRPETTQD